MGNFPQLQTQQLPFFVFLTVKSITQLPNYQLLNIRFCVYFAETKCRDLGSATGLVHFGLVIVESDTIILQNTTLYIFIVVFNYVVKPMWMKLKGAEDKKQLT